MRESRNSLFKLSQGLHIQLRMNGPLPLKQPRTAVISSRAAPDLLTLILP
jgi:hypothetical protein